MYKQKLYTIIIRCEISMKMFYRIFIYFILYTYVIYLFITYIVYYLFIKGKLFCNPVNFCIAISRNCMITIKQATGILRKEKKKLRRQSYFIEMDSAIGVHINVVFIWQRSRMFAANNTPISRAIQQQKHGLILSILMRNGNKELNEGYFVRKHKRCVAVSESSNKKKLGIKQGSLRKRFC